MTSDERNKRAILWIVSAVRRMMRMLVAVIELLKLVKRAIRPITFAVAALMGIFVLVIVLLKAILHDG